MYSTTVADPAAISLRSLFTDAPAAKHADIATVLRRWASEHLSKSHPELGRKGAVCPFTGSSIKKDLFRVAFVDGADVDRDTIAAALRDVIDEFRSIAVDSRDEILKTALLVFPDLADTQVIDDVQREFKDAFLEYDLMIGQFYPGCAERGLWNADFRPLDAPVPMIAVRQMTSSDYPFLIGNEQWAAAYLSKFAPNIPARVRQDMAAKIAGRY